MAHKARVHEENEEPEMQMASFADVMTILVFFFVATAKDELNAQRADLELPRAAEAVEEDVKAGTFIVNIEPVSGDRSRFRLKVRDRVFEAKELVPMIYTARMAYEANPVSKEKFRVIIRGDKTAPYSKIKEVMLASGDAGVTDVLFNAIAGQKGPENAPN
jgi:biopolymer transport protein ExbD